MVTNFQEWVTLLPVPLIHLNKYRAGLKSAPVCGSEAAEAGGIAARTLPAHVRPGRCHSLQAMLAHMSADALAQWKANLRELRETQDLRHGRLQPGATYLPPLPSSWGIAGQCANYERNPAWCLTRWPAINGLGDTNRLYRAKTQKLYPYRGELFCLACTLFWK